MRPVRANGKLELKEKLVGRRADGPVRPAILPADLTELARPVRENERAARVAQRRVVCTLRPVEADAGEPAARELVIGGRVEAVRVLEAVQLIAAAPDHLGAGGERAI